MKPRVDIDIARNIKTIEWLKTELLGSVADLFREMRDAREETIIDQLANVTIASYVLGRRLGVDFDRIDDAIKQKVLASVEQPHQFEEWYGDYSALSRHLEKLTR